MFRFYLGNMLLPVAPESLSVTVQNQNSSVSLVDESEFTILKKNGLTRYVFKFLLPSKNYHFSIYENNSFQDPEYFIDNLEKYKANKSVFDFTVLSPKHSQGIINKRVNLENLSYAYTADGTGDVSVEISLKEYIHHSTKIVTIKDDLNDSGTEDLRPPPSTDTNSGKKYTIVSGDTLIGIALKFYQDANRYHEIYNANKTKLDSIASSRGFPSESGHWWIFPGTEIIIP